MKFDKSRAWDVLKIFLLFWFFMTLLFLFILGTSGIIVGFIITVIMTVIVVPLYWHNWKNLTNQLP